MSKSKELIKKNPPRPRFGVRTVRTSLKTHATQLEKLGCAGDAHTKSIRESKEAIEALLLDGGVASIPTRKLTKTVGKLLVEEQTHRIYALNMHACSLIISYLAEGVISEADADRAIARLPRGVGKSSSLAEVIHVSNVAFECDDEEDDEWDEEEADEEEE